MKFFFCLMVLCSAVAPIAASADQYSDAYETCRDFRRATFKRQTEIARQSGYTRARVLGACNEIFNPPRSSTRQTPVSRNTGAASQIRTCTGSVHCHTSQQCINHRCVDRQKHTCTTNGRDQCPGGEKCVGGTCR